MAFGVFLGAGFGLVLGALPRLFLPVGILIAVAGWVAVQNLGGILTGAATDVGTGPVLILLALAFWPLARARSDRAGEPSVVGERVLPEPQRETPRAAGPDLGT